MNIVDLDKYYNLEKTVEDTTKADAEKIADLLYAAKKYRERLEEVEKFPAQFETFVAKHEKKRHFSYNSGSEVERLDRIVENYNSIARNSLIRVQQFSEQMIIHFRALSLALEMTGNGYTHHEKNARLRGAIEILEKTISHLQNHRFDFSSDYWGFMPNDFRSDYPVRDLLSRVRELECENEELKKTQTTEAEVVEPDF